jgi:hypothetical protein
MIITEIENGYLVDRHGSAYHTKFFATFDEVAKFVNNSKTPKNRTTVNITDLTGVTEEEAAADQERVNELARNGEI